MKRSFSKIFIVGIMRIAFAIPASAEEVLVCDSIERDTGGCGTFRTASVINSSEFKGSLLNLDSKFDGLSNQISSNKLDHLKQMELLQIKLREVQKTTLEAVATIDQRVLNSDLMKHLRNELQPMIRDLVNDEITRFNSSKRN